MHSTIMISTRPHLFPGSMGTWTCKISQEAEAGLWSALSLGSCSRPADQAKQAGILKSLFTAFSERLPEVGGSGSQPSHAQAADSGIACGTQTGPLLWEGTLQLFNMKSRLSTQGAGFCAGPSAGLHQCKNTDCADWPLNLGAWAAVLAFMKQPMGRPWEGIIASPS